MLSIIDYSFLYFDAVVLFSIANIEYECMVGRSHLNNHDFEENLPWTSISTTMDAKVLEDYK